MVGAEITCPKCSFCFVADPEFVAYRVNYTRPASRLAKTAQQSQGYALSRLVGGITRFLSFLVSGQPSEGTVHVLGHEANSQGC